MKKRLQVLFAVLLAAGMLFSVVNTVTATTVHPKSAEQVLKETKQAAKNGKVINSPFGLGTKKVAIVRKYGKPGPNSTADYLNYPKRHVFFTLEHNKVVRIVTTDPSLLKVNKDQVLKVLKKPNSSEGAAGHVYWTYDLGNNELIFNWQNVDPNVGKLLDVTVQKKG